AGGIRAKSGWIPEGPGGLPRGARLHREIELRPVPLLAHHHRHRRRVPAAGGGGRPATPAPPRGLILALLKSGAPGSRCRDHLRSVRGHACTSSTAPNFVVASSARGSSSPTHVAEES